jgi:hypothetical protein
MKYMQTGGFQNNPLMRLTLLLAMLFLTAFWVTNFALYFSKMGMTAESVADYYLGSEEQFRMPRTFQSMLEVTHSHLPMMAMVVLLLTHLLIFAPFEFRTKVLIIAAGFASSLLNETAGWLVRYVHPAFAWLKVFSFLAFQGVLGFLIVSLVAFLLRKRETGSNGNGKTVNGTIREEKDKAIITERG